MIVYIVYSTEPNENDCSCDNTRWVESLHFKESDAKIEASKYYKGYYEPKEVI